MPQILFLLAVALFVVTIVGHGLWLLGAAIVRGLAGETQAPTLPRRFCPSCGAERLVRNGRCVSCQRLLWESPATRLERVRKQLRELSDGGALSADRQREIDTLIQAELDERVAREESVLSAEAPSPAPTARPAGAARRTEAPTAKPAEQHREPTPERKPLSGLLQTFMEQRNIRWIEIVSGMLIVGSSIGLVVSLWATLRDAIPYFPALMFLLGTAAIHGAGTYTLKAWDLKSTSRGLLVISLLLVPLNYLAAIALSEQRPVTDLLYVISVALGTSIFSAIVWSGGRMLVGRTTPLLFAGVMLPCLTQLVVARVVAPDMARWRLDLVFGPAVLGLLVAVIGQAVAAARWKSATAARAGRAWLLAGVATFAFLVTLGLTLWKHAPLRETLAGLSPLLSASLVGLLVLGVVLQRALASREVSEWRVAATALAVLSSALLLVAAALAWPRPGVLLTVALVDFAALTAAAVFTRSAYLHVPAHVALGLAAVIGVNVATGRLDFAPPEESLLHVLFSGRSAVVLTALAIAAGLVGRLLKRVRRTDAAACAWSATLLAGLSGVGAVYSGFGPGDDGSLAVVVLLIDGIAVIAAGGAFGAVPFTWIGSGLILAGFVQATTSNAFVADRLDRLPWTIERPVVFAFLAHAVVMSLTSIAQVFGRRDGEAAEGRRTATTLAFTALATSIATVPWVLFPVRGLFGWHAGYALAVAVVWAVVSWQRGWPWLFAAGRVLATVAVLFAVTAVCREVPGWGDSIFHARQFTAQVAALAVWSMLGVAARRVSVGPSFRRLWEGPTAYVDRAILGLPIAGVVWLSLLLGWPGVTAELAATASEMGTAPFVVPVLLVLFALAAAGTSAAASRPRVESLFASGTIVLSVLVGVPDRLVGLWWQLGVPASEAAALPLAWVALGLVVCAVLVAWERLSERGVSLLAIVLVGVPLLSAAQFGESAAASFLRWGLAAYGLIAAAVLLRPRSLARVPGRPAEGEGERDGTTDLGTLRNVAVALSVAPVLGLTLRFLLMVAGGWGVAGPAAESWFSRLDASWSIAVPLVVVVATLLLHRRGSGSVPYALAACWAVSMAVGGFFVAEQWEAGSGFRTVELVAFLQASGFALAGCALVWAVARARFGSSSEQRLVSDASFAVEAAVTGGLLAWLAVWAIGSVVVSPGRASPVLTALAEWPGPVGLVLLAAACVWASRRRWPEAVAHGSGVLGVGLLGFLAAALAFGENADRWVPYHVLQGGWAALGVAFAVVACGLSWRRRGESAGRFARLAKRLARVGTEFAGWAIGFVAAAVLLAGRGLPADPQRPWWAVGTLGVAAVCAGGLSVRGRSLPGSWVSAVLAVLAAVAAGLRPWLWPELQPTEQSVVDLIEMAFTALAASALAWLTVELVRRRRFGTRLDPDGVPAAVHHFGTLILLTALAATVVAGFAMPDGREADVTGPWFWATFGLVTVLAVGRLWDREAPLPVAGVSAVGLIGAATVVHELAIVAERLTLAFAVAAAVWVLVTGIVWHRRRWLLALGRRIGLPDGDRFGREAGSWLPVLSLVLTGVVVGCAFHAILTLDDTWLRITAAAAMAATVPGLVALAEGERRVNFLTTALLLAAVSLIGVAWALPMAEAGVASLQYAVRLLVVTATAAFVYGAGLVRCLPSTSEWREAVRRAAAITGGAAVVSLLLVLALEARWFDPVDGAPVGEWQIAVVAGVLVALSAALVSMAVLPDRDVLRLPEEARSLYVYAAQAVLALGFLHVYLTLPALFRGLFQPYWPLVAMGIAFFGAGVGEVLRRSRVPVLANPLHRVSVFLPLLPALGFWLQSSRTEFSTVLFLAGLLYVLVASWRHHVGYVAAAALAGNAGLWALWTERGTQFLEHPQVWLIPPAVSVLVAAQLNRNRLTETQLQSLRYVSILVVYASSTGEMFLTGVGESLVLPMVLAGLSVLGVFAGIGLRVRAFLYLGATFLLLSIVSMVWHAARNIGHVWPWWAFGITLGLLILAVFGVLEKKRPQVMQLLHELRRWER